MTALQKTGRITELDGWRAISVMLVIFHHIIDWTFPNYFYWHHQSLYQLGFWIGPLAVKFFFFISGFVITLGLLKEEQRGSVSYEAFYLRRALRILPPVFVFLAAVVLLRAAGWILEESDSIIASMFLMGNVPIFPHTWFSGHLWSIGVEEQFYLCFPLIWVFAPRRHRSSLLFSAMLLFQLWSIAQGAFNWGGYVDNGLSFACIAVGTVTAIHYEKVRAVVARIPLVAVIVVALLVFFQPFVPELHGARGLGYRLLTPAAVALLIVATINRDASARVLNSRILQWLGKISFSLYLWQELFTGKSIYYSPVFHWVMLVTFPLVFPLAWASYRFIELPGQRLGRRLTQDVAATGSVTRK
ncbi:MAG: acyltransferase family protein [Janthinobacterium lividum]